MAGTMRWWPWQRQPDPPAGPLIEVTPERLQRFLLATRTPRRCPCCGETTWVLATAGTSLLRWEADGPDGDARLDAFQRHCGRCGNIEHIAREVVVGWLAREADRDGG